MSYACSELGTDFVSMISQGDPAGVIRCAEAYDGVMRQVDDNVRKPVDERLVAEVIGSVGTKLAEMSAIKARIDARVSVKREYDYYYTKVT